MRTTAFVSLERHIGGLSFIRSDLFNQISLLLTEINLKNIKSEDLPCLKSEKSDIHEATLRNQLLFEHYYDKAGTSIPWLQFLIQYANNVDANPYGNCLDMAIYGFLQALKKIMLDPENYSGSILKIIFFGPNQGHFAIEIERGGESIILDPWAGVVFPSDVLDDILIFESTSRDKDYPPQFPSKIYDRAFLYFQINTDTGKCMSIVEDRIKEASTPSSVRSKSILTGFRWQDDSDSESFYSEIKANKSLLDVSLAKIRLLDTYSVVGRVTLPRAGLFDGFTSTLTTAGAVDELMSAFKAREAKLRQSLDGLAKPEDSLKRALDLAPAPAPAPDPDPDATLRPGKRSKHETG